MNDVEGLWESAKAFIRQELSDVGYITWIEPLKALALENNVMVLDAQADFRITLLEQRYAEEIKKALHKAAPNIADIKFVSDKEAQEYLQKKSAAQNSGAEKGFSFSLSPRYTFETFVVGGSNRFAHAGALAVSESPGQSYNPLFIYGGVGLGKTHLMHAIGNNIVARYPSYNVKYITSEAFTNDLITTLQYKKDISKFRARYRSVDVLLIDDIQFLSGKESTYEEFFHTFNDLYSENKQIVISSDMPPHELPRLEERLRSRFEWGLIADIGRPDYETRVAILRMKAWLDNMVVDDAVLEFIASNVETNIRELEGILLRVKHYCDLHNRQIDLPMTKEALKGALATIHSRQITTQTVKDLISDHYSVSISGLEGKKRDREIVFPRQLAMYITREIVGASYPDIGKDFGGRDHTTVLHACRKIEDSMREDSRLRSTVRELIDRLKKEK